MAVESGLVTARDLMAMPSDGVRRELSKGDLQVMPPAGGDHGRRAFWFGHHLGAFIARTRAGEAFAAETGFHLARDPDTVRAPDFAFVRGERLTGRAPTGFIPLAPDLVLEVVSPGDSAAEVRARIDDWLRAGCGAVWVLYPGPRLEIHRAAGIAILGPDDAVEAADILPGFQMRLGDLIEPPAAG